MGKHKLHFTTLSYLCYLPIILNNPEREPWIHPDITEESDASLFLLLPDMWPGNPWGTPWVKWHQRPQGSRTRTSTKRGTKRRIYLERPTNPFLSLTSKTRVLTALVFPEHLVLPRQKKKKKHAAVVEESLTWTTKEKVEEKETVGTPAEGVGGTRGSQSHREKGEWSLLIPPHLASIRMWGPLK